MALDVKTAKRGVKKTSQSDPDFDDALQSAKDFQLNMLKENNRHAEATHSKNLGFLGRALGGEASAPTHVALLATLLGLAAVAFCYYTASHSADQADFWGKQAERALAFSLACLTFIFGRGTSKP